MRSWPLTIDRRDLKTNIGGEIGAIAEDGIDPRRRVTMGRFSVLAVLAAGEALASSGLDLSTADPTRIGAVIGVAVWGADAVDESYLEVFLEGKNGPTSSPYRAPCQVLQLARSACNTAFAARSSA